MPQRSVRWFIIFLTVAFGASLLLNALLLARQGRRQVQETNQAFWVPWPGDGAVVFLKDSLVQSIFGSEWRGTTLYKTCSSLRSARSKEFLLQESDLSPLPKGTLPFFEFRRGDSVADCALYSSTQKLLVPLQLDAGRRMITVGVPQHLPDRQDDLLPNGDIRWKEGKK